jgi:hypothetical protein
MRFRIEYLVDSKIELDSKNIGQNHYDIFISCYNNSERVKWLYRRINAVQKIWIIIPEYGYEKSEYPKEVSLVGDSFNEADLIHKTVGNLLKCQKGNLKICIDITGFMRPQIIFLIKYLKYEGIKRYDLIYAEPNYYKNKSETSFTTSDVEDVRQIAGYEGVLKTDTQNDVLILGVGYDHNLMSRVVLNKDNARLILLHSLPSLRADMYQESLLRLHRVSAISTKISEENTYFACANDPFVIANVLSIIYKRISLQQNISNLYLCPLATKPQALGFSMFYLKEMEEKCASILFPFSSSYSRETSKGIGKIWLYSMFIE